MTQRTRSKTASLLLLLCLVLGTGQTVWADLSAEDQPLEERVVGFAQQLRLGISVASFAVYAPTLRDLRLHAQQLINLLEGASGRDFVRSEEASSLPVGLLVELTAWSRRFSESPLETALRTQVSAATRNVRIYLDLAVDAALSILDQRRLDLATTDMLRVYAYLTAAYERPSESAAIPALQTILRVFGVEDTENGEDTG